MTPDARVHRVHRAVLFIEPRLFSPLTSQSVADAVGGSVYQLHRYFTDVYGVSLAAYIRARRMSEAARMLRSSQRDVLSIALKCQYGSQAAFTRAFRKQFGVPPAEFRRGSGLAHTAVGAATVQELMHRDSLERAPRLVWLHEDRPLVGLSAVVDPTSLADFQEAQEALVQEVGEQHEAVGVAHLETPDGQLHFFLGIDAGATAKALEVGRLERGLYAVFHHRGSPETVRHSIAFFAQSWEPGPEMQVGVRPSAEIFQLADRAAETLELSLWLAVESTP